MKVLLLSDIHSNLEALQAVLNDSRCRDYREIWFLGDLCGYGPDPDACFKLLSDRKALMIAGNHDLALCGRIESRYFSEEARMSLIMTRSIMGGDTLTALKSIPLMQTRKGILLVHGSPEGPSRNYILGDDDALGNFSITREKCILFGHTHVQEYYSLDRKELTNSRPGDGESASWKKGRILINPGSVGQPRDGDKRAAWALLDLSRKEATFFRTEYALEETQEKMQRLGFSDFLINRLERGR